MIKVLFVCMGNICRSPTAHGFFRKLVEESGLSQSILIESAGTHGFYHRDEPPDPRAQQAALKQQVDISDLRARQVVPEDFNNFDYVLAMDKENYHNLAAICPSTKKHKLKMFLAFAPQLTVEEVPDPYYTEGEAGFEYVFKLVEAASRGLLADIRQRL